MNGPTDEPTDAPKFELTRRDALKAGLLAGALALTGCRGKAAAPAIVPSAVVAPFAGPKIECDVLVVGGTPSGVAAALAAARRGASVVLVEPRALLGGDIVYALLNMFDVPMRRNGTSPAAHGIFGEFFHELGIAFDVERARRVFDAKVAAQPNIRLLKSTRLTRVNRDGARVVGAIFEPSEGAHPSAHRVQITAGAIVDATNDADFATRAGAHSFIGRQASGIDRRMQSAGLLFAVKGARWNAMHAYATSVQTLPVLPRADLSAPRAPSILEPIPAPTALVKPSAVQTVRKRLGGAGGNYIWESGQVVKGYQTRGANIMALSINFGRQQGGDVILNTINIIGVNGLDGASKRSAHAAAAAELETFVPYLRGAMPGLEHIELSQIAPELYIRETRHLQGLYRLTVQDIRAQTHFPDRIALVSYPVDLHPYRRGDLNPYGPRRYFYTIPLRALIPTNIEGVLVASRSLSAQYEAAGSARVIPITMAMGEAAGAAAHLCASERITPAQLANSPQLIARLQRSLVERGAVIGGAVIGGAVIGGAVIGGAVIGGA